MFQCENDLYESKCIKITTTTTTTTTECFLKARQKNSDALKNFTKIDDFSIWQK